MASRHCAVLSGLLAPVWLPTGSFIDQLYQWERNVLEYENAARVPLPSTVRCAVVQRWAPPAVKEFLRLTPLELTTDYSQLRNALIQYSARGRVFDAMGLPRPREPAGPPVPMEIDALQRQGPGKGGGGKGGFTGMCNRCGKVGHKKADCYVDLARQGGGEGAGRGGGKGGAKGKGKSKLVTGGNKGAGSRQQRQGGGKGQMRAAGTWFSCGLLGRRAADCRRGRMQAALTDEEESAPVYRRGRRGALHRDDHGGD